MIAVIGVEIAIAENALGPTECILHQRQMRAHAAFTQSKIFNEAQAKSQVAVTALQSRQRPPPWRPRLQKYVLQLGGCGNRG